MQVKVSIVLPAHNAGRKIERCINSILNQTIQEFEIICVDDKSSDNTVEIIEKLMKN